MDQSIAEGMDVGNEFAHRAAGAFLHHLIYSNHAAREGIKNGSLELVGFDMGHVGVEERPEWSRYFERRMLLDIGCGENGFVDDAAARDFLSKSRGYRNVDSGRHEVANLMKGECSLMREDCLRLSLPVETPE